MKKLTLILFMMIALVGLKANAAMYIVGDAPFGGWNPAGGVEMTDNEDGTYSCKATINGTVNFVFADGLNEDWDIFNSQFRYGPATGDTQISANTWINTSKAGDHGAYKFEGSGDEYVFTFDLTDPNQAKFKVEGYVAPLSYDSYTVAGEPAELFGYVWAPDYETNDMTLDGGLYTWTKENVTLTTTTIKFKVVAEHSWDVASWPANNYEVNLEHAGTYNVTITFNPATRAVTCEATLAGDVIDDYYIVAGTESLFGSFWNATDSANLMTEGENGIFTLTKEGFEAHANDVVEFKVVANGNWDTCWPQSNEEGDNNKQYQFEQDGVYDVTITFNEETKEISVNAVRTGDLPEPPQPEVDDVYIIGDVNNFSTTGWDPTKGAKLTYNEGIYTGEVTTTPQEGQELAYIGFSKKLADPASENPWNEIEPYRFGPSSMGDFIMTEELLGTSCELDMETYESIGIPEGTWTVTVDLDNSLFKVEGTWPVDTVVPEPYTGDLFVLGEANGNGWGPNVGVQMTYDSENAVFTANIAAKAQNYDSELEANYSYFSFTKVLADDWAAIADSRIGAVAEGNFLVTDEYLDVPLNLTAGEVAFKVPSGYYYDLTVSVDSMTLIITRGDAVEPDPVEHYTGDVYVLGDVNDNGGWFTNVGAKMNRDEENNLYTLIINTTGEAYVDPETNIGYSYFSFTKQLVDSAADWDGITPYRFGAVSDGDFWVTEDILGQTLPLVNNGQSFRAPAGDWKLTLSVDEMTLIIEKVIWPEGDVNHDFVVDVSDVTATIAVALGGVPNVFYEAQADLNEDGIIDVSDVTAVIARVLSNQ